MRSIGPQKISWNTMVFLFLLWCGPPGLAQTNWWNPNWNYRIPLTVEPTNTEPYNRLVAATIHLPLPAIGRRPHDDHFMDSSVLSGNRHIYISMISSLPH